MTTITREQELILAEHLATRLCHDMAGLCGTLVGVLELATEDPGSVAEALPLAHEMAASLAARLRLLRAAWGPAGEPLDAASLAVLGQGLPGAPRLSLDLSGLEPGRSLPPSLARVTLNALLLGVEALPGGGTLSLSHRGDGVAVAIAGRRPGWPAGLAELLDQPQRAVAALREAGPRRLQLPMLVLLAEAARLRLWLTQEPRAAAATLHIAEEGDCAG